ncbi:MAG: histidine phosphatase family protein [Rhodothermus sp.]|nr:histidine phosphatase family protein [Rhodothermus sp.]
MRLYFLRHAEARPATPGQPDAERTLTEAGQQIARHLGEALRRMQLAPAAVYSSPYRRAVQTARAVATALCVPVVEDRLLAPGCGPAELELLVQAYTPGNTVLVVGHQPDLGELVRWLTGASIRLPAGGLAIVETPMLREQAGTLHGLYDPRWLRTVMTGSTD